MTRSVGTQATTITEVISGKTTTETTELVNVITVTATGNQLGANADQWYGTATSPCVSLDPVLKNRPRAEN